MTVKYSSGFLKHITGPKKPSFSPTNAGQFPAL